MEQMLGFRVVELSDENGKVPETRHLGSIVRQLHCKSDNNGESVFAKRTPEYHKQIDTLVEVSGRDRLTCCRCFNYYNYRFGEALADLVTDSPYE
jgi:hypothetical protein